MRILSVSVEEILEMVKVLEQEAKQMKFELTKICWLMRGSISFDEVYQLSQEDLEIIGKVVKENFEITKKTGLPYF